MVRALVLLCLLAYPPPAARAEPPAGKAKAQEKVEEKTEEEKDDSESGFSAESAAAFATSLSAAITALFTLYNLPGNVKNARVAWQNLYRFAEHNKAFLEAKQEVEAFAKKRPELMAELTRTFYNYKPSLDAVDNHVRTAFVGEPVPLERAYERVEKDLEALLEIPGAGRWRPELEAALEAWRSRRGADPIETWINEHLQTKFLSEGPGREWLLQYVRHQKEVGAAYWLERGSTIELDRWVKVNEKRVKLLGNDEKRWKKTLSDLREKETQAAREFLREFATFTRALNHDIADPARKLALLIAAANREPGEFHTSDEGVPKSLTARKLLAYAESRCGKTYEALQSVQSAAAAKISIVPQVFTGVLPVATGAAAAGTSYLTIRSFIQTFFPSPKAGEGKGG